jgi:hypothetical protein
MCLPIQAFPKVQRTSHKLLTVVSLASLSFACLQLPIGPFSWGERLRKTVFITESLVASLLHANR